MRIFNFILLMLGLVSILSCEQQEEAVSPDQTEYIQEEFIDQNESESDEAIESNNKFNDEPEIESEIEKPNKIALKHLTPLFSEPITQENFHKSTLSSVYQPEGSEFSTREYRDEWVSVRLNNSNVPSWIPVWYGTDSAEDIKNVLPTRVTFDAKAKLYVFPDSSVNKRIHTPDESFLPEQEEIFSIYQWEDWIGILLPPELWYEGLRVHQPTLFWVHESEIHQSEPMNRGLFSTEISLKTISHISEILLQPGTDKALVRQLLGDPDVFEVSRNLNSTGEPPKYGESWRYERTDGHIALAFYEDELQSTKWTLPITLEDQVNSTSMHSSTYSFRYQFSQLPLVPTIEPDWDWKTEVDLSHNFIWSVTDEILLIVGDDGGFSGMHYDSNMYALDRKSGTKLWQIDAGYGGIHAVLDQNMEHASIYTGYNPDTQENISQVRHIRLRDGKLMWEKDFDSQSSHLLRLLKHSSEDTLITYEKDYDPRQFHLRRQDTNNDDIIWEKNYDEYVQFLNERSEEPWILLKQNHELQAIRPDTGQIKWQVEGTKLEENMRERGFINSRRNPFEPYIAERWIQLGSELVLINIINGEILSRYPTKQNELIYVIDERFLLIQKALDHLIYREASEFETQLFDANHNKVLWSVEGRATGATIGDDQIYLFVNGVPSAFELWNGKLTWQMNTNGFISKHLPFYSANSFIISGDDLIFSHGSDLTAIDKFTGEPKYRVKDIITGHPGHSFESSDVRLINIEEGYIYMGSANGFFTKFKLP